MSNLKKLLIFICITVNVIFFIVGCSQQKVNSNEEPEIQTNVSTTISIEQEPEITNNIIVNKENKEVIYEYETNSEVIQDCVANENELYLLQAGSYEERPYLYTMKLGENNAEKVNLAIPDNLEISILTTDMEGNLHLLLHSYEKTHMTYKEWQIWKIDRDNNVETKLDVSDVFEGKTYPPYAFYIDKSGNYYIQGTWEMVPSIVIDKQGVLINTINIEHFGVEFVQSVGRGKDGKIYMIYSGEKSGTIGILDGTKGVIEKEYPNILPQNDDQFFVLGPGTDTDLLIYSKLSGLWVCDLEENKATQRVVMTDKDIPENMVIVNEIFIPDGRFLRIENWLKENGDFSYRKFNYIAGGN